MQLCNQIVEAIAVSKLQEGESLPSVRQMAEYAGINMHTVNKAYALLRQEGYITLDKKTGSQWSNAVKNHRMEFRRMGA